ncbi:MAG: outer membrane beta-barrel protein [Fimbriimonadaceae bacterium]|nr:outer membrane beta-barrel protein [Chitinophagales bacterium]
MKRDLFSIGVVCIGMFYHTSISAQVFNEGQMSGSIGYGFPNFTRTLFNLADGVSDLESHVYGPMYGKFEYAVNDVIGFGVNVAYTYGNASYETTNEDLDSIIYNTSFIYQSYSVLGRLNFHFGDADKVDPYAGIGMGYRNSNYKYKSDDPNFDEADVNSFLHFGVDLTLGARFYLTDNIGIYGEVGLAKSPLQIGLIATF